MEARQPFERALELDPTSNEPLMHLIQVALIERDHALLDSLTSDLERRNLGPMYEAMYRTIRSHVLSDGPDAEIEEQFFDDRPVGRMPTAWMLLGGGHFHEAETVVRPLTRADRPRPMQAAEGDAAAARQTAAQLHELDPPAFAVSGPSDFALSIQAELLADAGRHEEALAWYGTFDGVGVGEPLYMAPAHFGRAQTLEVAGRPDDAAEAYERFLELWREPDPMLGPKVEEARERLESLTREGS